MPCAFFRGIRIPHGAKGFPGDTHCASRFRAHRNEFRIKAQGIGQEPIPCVTAVPANVFVLETGADADFNPVFQWTGPCFADLKRI
jgi:hypothetical protein